MEKAFRGTCRECLVNLADATRNIQALEASMSSFCGVIPITAKRWLKGAPLPGGAARIRLLFFLEGRGYQVREVEELDVLVRDLARFIAYGALDEDAAAGELEFTSRHGIFRLILRQGRTQPHRMERISLLVARLSVSHPEIKAPAKREVSPKRSPSRPGPVPGHGLSPKEKTGIVKSVAHSVIALLPLVDMVLSDDFTSAERKALRALADEDGVFRLSNRISRLCGETARREMSEPVNSVRNEGV